MQVREVMSPDVRLTDPDATLQEAARAMADGDFGLLPVGQGDRLVGTVTDRDICVRAVAAGLAPGQATVRDVMSEGIRYCFDDQDVDEAAESMARNQVRRMPVVDRDKRLVGLVSLGDLTRNGAEVEAGEALSGVSTASL